MTDTPRRLDVIPSGCPRCGGCGSVEAFDVVRILPSGVAIVKNIRRERCPECDRSRHVQDKQEDEDEQT